MPLMGTETRPSLGSNPKSDSPLRMAVFFCIRILEDPGKFQDVFFTDIDPQRPHIHVVLEASPMSVRHFERLTRNRGVWRGQLLGFQFRGSSPR